MTHRAYLPAISTEIGLAEYMQQIKKFPMLSADEEQSLAKRLVEHADVQAAHKLVTSHLRLVVKIAQNFKGYGLPIMEVISEGNIGLMKAVKRFDHTKGFRLSTYAMWWIKASIQEYVLRSWSLVKIGTTAAQKRLFFNLRKMKQRLQAYGSGDLEQEQLQAIASELNVTEEEVTSMNRRLTHGDTSLHEPIGFEDTQGELIDMVASEKESHDILLADYEEQSHMQKILQNAIAQLNEREQYIIHARKLREPVATLEDLSQELSVSRERVRQIEARAMEKLIAFAKNEAA